MYRYLLIGNYTWITITIPGEYFIGTGSATVSYPVGELTVEGKEED